ncbi:hypothetical protein [Novosphingobium album (ex Liu et al. 2023)]|uniref:Uncharacterized protein n=1 Tax=Novosphingobium album (ex Liu et al. 2023) TaxID=3031130 RepID=A0ABT5WL88_9SPHN|nr:hypothetical protein [Novosphingobium album (ex Liu et al. 2023)]MDE8650807.1 hypothetical protein [Novosphingobium album (ex Liu et al. 2023)]
MIEADADTAFAGLAARLTARAQALARAAIARRLLSHRDEATPWRRAALLWPLFAKG